MISIFENKIINKLKDVFPDFEIESFPAKFEEYHFTSSVGCMLVRYDNTVFSTSQLSVWEVTQSAQSSFSIIIGLRSLCSFNESYPFLQRLKESLLGLEIQGKKIILKNEEFLDEINGDLWWGLSVKIDLITQENEILS